MTLKRQCGQSHLRKDRGKGCPCFTGPKMEIATQHKKNWYCAWYPLPCPNGGCELGVIPRPRPKYAQNFTYYALSIAQKFIHYAQYYTHIVSRMHNF